VKRLLYILILVMGLLAACSQREVPATLDSLAINLEELRGLTVPFLYPPNSGKDFANCLVNEFKLPGQGYKIKGVEGGLSYTAITKAKTAFTIGSELKTSFFATATPNRHAAILVVDDFGPVGNEVYTLGNALFTQTTLDLATIQQLQDNGSLSHGALVFRQIVDEIRGTGLYKQPTTVGNKKVFLSNTTPAWRLEVIPVNTHLQDQQSTGLISFEIRKAIQAWNSSFIGASRYPISINMSFALFPCEPYDDYVAWDKLEPDVQTFEDYMTKLADFNQLPYDDLVKAVIESTNKTSDPLLSLIKNNSGAGTQYSAQKHAYIASAGNYSLDYSMYPANWDNVVNVTGSSVDDPTTAVNETTKRADFFNQGEVMHIAASFRLNPSPRLVFKNPNAKPFYFLGTSFSAPTVTTYSALDLATVRRCKNTPGVMPLSELAKAVPTLVDRPLETLGRTPGAVQVRCGSS
jgi:hypothetical protein